MIEDPLGRVGAAKDLHARLAGRLLSGSGVLAIVSGMAQLPPELDTLVTARATLPPITRRMLALILEYLHPGHDVDLPISENQLGKLAPVALAPVLAAETLDAALTQLRRLEDVTRSPYGGPGLDDVYGQPEAVEALRQVVSDLDAWRAGKLDWREVTKSFLLVGPPGTGKTMMAEALVRSAGITLVKTSYADVQKRGHQGDALKALNEAAERAKTGRPAAFFLDEIDSFYNINQSSNGGTEAIRTALDHLASRATGALDEAGKAFGPLYSRLNRDYLNDPGFDLFRNIMRDCILENWPIGPGETVLGQVVAERRLHSVTTAAKEAGIGTKVLEHFLVEAGAIAADDPRPQSRRLFDAKAYAELLVEIPTLVGPIAMRAAMGATRMELIALAAEGLLIPRTRVEKVKNPWRISDGVAFVAALVTGACDVTEDDAEWETLLLACRRSGTPLHELVQAIRVRRLTVGQQVGVPGFHGIVVPKSEFDVIAAPFRLTRNIGIEEVSGSMAAAKFGRSVGLRDGGLFQSMIEAGHVPASHIINPRTGRLQYRMTPEDMAAFHRRFVTLTTLSAETGQHRNTLKGLLAAHRISPFAPDGQDFGAVYLRADVAAIMR